MAIRFRSSSIAASRSAGTGERSLSEPTIALTGKSPTFSRIASTGSFKSSGPSSIPS
jgi:hypothetical protein